nr:MAG TPA: Pex protein clock associated protein, CIRCADIAN.7A [Caudoviricetes sp.]
MGSREERKEAKNMEHHFNVELAKEYGILEAVLLNNLQFWIEKNRANGTNFHDGHYWTYNSAKAFSELFPYASQKQIRKALQNLIAEGIIQTGNYNKNPYDRTLWYSFTEKGDSIFQMGKIDVPKRENGNDLEGQPIPDNKTDNKTDNKLKESKKEESNNTQIEHVEKTTCRKKKKTMSYDEQIAEYTQNEDLQNALKAFLQMRSFIKKPMTEYALKLMLKKLDELGNDDTTKIAILNQSITHNWQGIFPLKDEYTKYEKQPEKKYDQNGYESEEELMKMFYGK